MTGQQPPTPIGDVQGAILAMHAQSHFTAAQTAIIAVLEEVADYLHDRSDVGDGDYGVSVPNRAMRLLAEVKRAIELAERL